MARLSEIDVVKQKDNILRTALKLFNQKGFHGTKLNEVAKISGISRSPIYYHFKDKKTLYEAVIDFASSKWFDRQVEISNENLNVFDVLEKMLLESLEGEFEISEIFLSEMKLHTHKYEETSKRFFQKLKNIRQLIINILEKGKQEGTLIKEANSQLISENLSAISSGLMDMKRYFDREEVKVIDTTSDQYIKALVNEYISSIEAKYGKK